MPIWYVGRPVLTPYKRAFERIREGVRFLNALQQVTLARFSKARNGHKRYLFLRVDAPTRDRAVEFLDSICRVARSFARSEGQDVEFGDRLLPVNPDSIPLTVDPQIWHFTRGVYVVGAEQATWRVPTAPRLPRGDAIDPLGLPEVDVPSLPQEADPAALLQSGPTLAFSGPMESHRRVNSVCSYGFPPQDKEAGRHSPASATSSVRQLTV